MQDSMILQIVLQIFLIMLNAVFACAEIAVISVNDSRLDQLAAKGNNRAVRLQRLVSQPARFLATIQVAITLSGFLGSAFAADNFSDKLTSLLLRTGVPIPENTLDTISVILITLILSYFTLVFGELVPKRLAMKKSEQIALGISAPVSAIAKLFAPIVWLLTASTNLILRILGIDPNAEDDSVSEEEIRMMVDQGNKKGIIDNEENEIIQNVFEFDDLTVGEFATHRTEISLLWVEETMEQWEKTIRESRHMMYPICDETADHVVGILDTRDFFRMESREREQVMQHAVKPAYFVPETVKADVLFKQMKASRNYFAVVLDEYGGTLGIVTINDLIGQLIGEMETEDDAEAGEDIERVDSQTWKIKGSARLDDVAETLAIELPLDEYDTFGGYVFGLHGSVPEDGKNVEVTTDQLQIRTIKIKGHKLEQAVVCRLESNEE